MSATRCTCLRIDMRRVLPDPDCDAPSHRFDETDEKNANEEHVGS
jgi:hypothetical protein